MANHRMCPKSSASDLAQSGEGQPDLLAVGHHRVVGAARPKGGPREQRLRAGKALDDPAESSTLAPSDLEIEHFRPEFSREHGVVGPRPHAGSDLPFDIARNHPRHGQENASAHQCPPATSIIRSTIADEFLAAS